MSDTHKCTSTISLYTNRRHDIGGDSQWCWVHHFLQTEHVLLWLQNLFLRQLPVCMLLLRNREIYRLHQIFCYCSTYFIVFISKECSVHCHNQFFCTLSLQEEQPNRCVITVLKKISRDVSLESTVTTIQLVPLFFSLPIKS